MTRQEGRQVLFVPIQSPRQEEEEYQRREDSGNNMVFQGPSDHEAEKQQQQQALQIKGEVGPAVKATQRSQTTWFMILAIGSIVSALGFSTLQEKVFNIPGFEFGGWMTFLTYATYTFCGWLEALLTGNMQRHAPLKDFFLVSILAMSGAYFTNWALNYLNYTTRIVFKSCRVLPVMAFRSLVVGARYSGAQYCAGLLLVIGIALFTMGDADGMPNFSYIGIILITIALVCDAMTANLEERQFFRIKVPCTHAEVMMYLSAFAAIESFAVIFLTGELWQGIEHSTRHQETVPYICAFSVLGYVTVCLVLLIIKGFGSTNAEIVKSMRKVCQVVLSFLVFPKPLSWKYMLGGALVAVALYWLQKTGKKPPSEQEPKQPKLPVTSKA